MMHQNWISILRNTYMNKFIHQNLNAIQGLFMLILGLKYKGSDIPLIYDAIEYIIVISID